METVKPESNGDKGNTARRLVALALILSAPLLLYGVEAADPIPNDGWQYLFDGHSLDGLHVFLPDGSNVAPAAVWSARDGVLRCTGEPHGYVRTTRMYSDYHLVFEWRWPDGGGNSGVLVHIHEPDKVWPKSIEGQMQHEHAGDIWVIGGTSFKEHTDPVNRRVPKQEASSEKPLGEWNQYEVIARGDTLQLIVNGVLQNVATETTVTSGYIGWQSEGTPVEFRGIMLRPLD